MMMITLAVNLLSHAKTSAYKRVLVLMHELLILWCVCMKLVTRLLEKTDPYIESSAFNLFTSLPSRDLYLFSYQVSD